MDGKALLAATDDEAVKAEYESNTEEAIRLGVFGAPTYVSTASCSGDRTACKCSNGG
jgi:2-hydroxychromene-2-carboxylate isomerase